MVTLGTGAKSASLVALLCLSAAWPVCAGSINDTGSRSTRVRSATSAAALVDAEQGRFEERSRPLQGYATEGTRAVSYSRDADTRKIEVEALGERGRRILQFYWRAGRLTVAREKRIDYAGSGAPTAGVSPSKDVVVMSDELVFEGRQLLRWGQFDREVALDTPEAVKRASEIQAEARSFLRLMRQKQPTPDCFWSCTRDRGIECLRFVCE